MTPRLWIRAAATLTVLTACATSARAQTLATPGFALNRYEPAERGSEWFANDSLDFRGHLRPALGITGDYGYKPYTLLNPDGSDRTSVVSNQLYLHVGASLVLWERLRVGASLPLALTQSGDSAVVGGRQYVAPDKPGVGDVRLAADVRILGQYGEVFVLAAGLRAWLPTGDESQFIGDGKARLGPRALVSGDSGLFSYAASIGINYRANDLAFAGHPTGTDVTFAAAGGVRLVDKKLLLGPEIYGSTVTSSFFGNRTTPLGLMLGGHYTAGDFRFGLGGGPGLSNAAGVPQFRVLLSVDLAPAFNEEKPVADRDKDGVPDETDACPDVPGIKTSDPKTNGCPAPNDKDNDGVIDGEDACPDVAGPRTRDPKTNGCPPPKDTDSDGVPDEVDACPTVAGVKTDDPKTNGCPPDRDHDGVPDATDACPDVAGVKTDDPKTNGCPSDRDKDGIVDTEDACPDAPGPKDPDPKKNGCPAVRIEAGQIKILEQIKFKTGSAEIVKDSQPIIDAVAKAMREHPEIAHLRVEGHTDNKGNAKLNKDLSNRRAASVVTALVKAGVDKGRFSSIGLGQEKPIDSNTTDAGRANNRRVEFHIEVGAK